tara:strand:- start:1292 stop:1471 length:180 start_codon:yes stop_codon:yes gene_type:complete
MRQTAASRPSVTLNGKLAAASSMTEHAMPSSVTQQPHHQAEDLGKTAAPRSVIVSTTRL